MRSTFNPCLTFRVLSMSSEGNNFGNVTEHQQDTDMMSCATEQERALFGGLARRHLSSSETAYRRTRATPLKPKRNSAAKAIMHVYFKMMSQSAEEKERQEKFYTARLMEIIKEHQLRQANTEGNMDTTFSSTSIQSNQSNWNMEYD